MLHPSRHATLLAPCSLHTTTRSRRHSCAGGKPRGAASGTLLSSKEPKSAPQQLATHPRPQRRPPQGPHHHPHPRKRPAVAAPPRRAQSSSPAARKEAGWGPGGGPCRTAEARRLQSLPPELAGAGRAVPSENACMLCGPARWAAPRYHAHGQRLLGAPESAQRGHELLTRGLCCIARRRPPPPGPPPTWSSSLKMRSDRSIESSLTNRISGVSRSRTCGARSQRGPGMTVERANGRQARHGLKLRQCGAWVRQRVLAGQPMCCQRHARHARHDSRALAELRPCKRSAWVWRLQAWHVYCVAAGAPACRCACARSPLAAAGPPSPSPCRRRRCGAASGWARQAGEKGIERMRTRMGAALSWLCQVLQLGTLLEPTHPAWGSRSARVWFT